MSIFNYLLKNWFGGKRNKYYTQHTKKGYTDYRTNEKKEQFKQQKKGSKYKEREKQMSNNSNRKKYGKLTRMNELCV